MIVIITLYCLYYTTGVQLIALISQMCRALLMVITPQSVPGYGQIPADVALNNRDRTQEKGNLPLKRV
jgi:hypothetical protein